MDITQLSRIPGMLPRDCKTTGLYYKRTGTGTYGSGGDIGDIEVRPLSRDEVKEPASFAINNRRNFCVWQKHLTSLGIEAPKIGDKITIPASAGDSGEAWIVDSISTSMMGVRHVLSCSRMR
jgi:hypothetical protein